MKKIYLAFVILWSFTFTNAQQLILIPNDSIEVSGTPADEFTPYDAHLEVINNSASAITITWGLESSSAPTQWGLGVCDNNNCYDLLFNGGPYVSLTVLAHDTMDMKMQYTSHCVAGTGTARVYAFVTGDSANSVVHLTYKENLAACVASSISNNSVPHLKIYPNPVRNSFVVSGLEDAGNLAFEVYNMKGATVKSEVKNATNTQIEISLANLSPGSYILKATDALGRVVGTCRLSKVD